MKDSISISAIMLEGEVPCLDVKGEVDAYTAGELRSKGIEMVENSASTLIINLSDVSYIDMSGMGALAGIQKSADANSAALALIAPEGSRCKRVLEIMRLDQVYDHFENKEDALAHLRKS